MYDLNDVEPHRGGELIPDGAFAKVAMAIRPGGVDGQGDFDKGILKASNAPGSDVLSLAAALTAPYWEDRILGKSETTRFPIRCVWIATGNNPQFSNELARRLVRIRLDAHVDQPWRRDGFRHPNLLAWVRANRARLVAACLTLGRAWIAAGMPRHHHTLGSFEAWAEVMGGILDAAGVPGFLANLDEMYEAADAEGATWRVFVALWWQRHGTAEVGTGDLHALALACEPPLPLGAGTEHAQRIRLGKALGRMRDRVFALGDIKVRIKAAGVRHQAQRWKLDLENRRPDKHSQHSPAEATSGECGECFSNPYACADARAPAYEDTPEKHSPTSPRSPSPEKSMTSEGERAEERGNGRSHLPAMPVSPGNDGEASSFDAIFETHGLDPLNDKDRATATRIWMGMPRRTLDTGAAGGVPARRSLGEGVR